MVSKQKIMIVDDDNNIAELISLYLTKECFECKIVNDGEEALSVFPSFQPNSHIQCIRDNNPLIAQFINQQIRYYRLR